MSTKVERLANRVRREVSMYSDSQEVKGSVGGSVNNNRVPTVRQTISYLNLSSFSAGVAQDLEQVYGILLKKQLFAKLRRKNNRSDAYDINEFLTVVTKFVSKDSGLKSTLGKAITTIV